MGKAAETRNAVQPRVKRKWYIDTDTGEIKPERDPRGDVEIWNAPATPAPMAVQAPDYIID